MSDVRITAGGYEFLAKWERERCPKTCEAFEKLLPYEQKIIHVRWSGESCWIPLGDYDLGVPWEDATSVPQAGEILFYPGGYSETEILGGFNWSSQHRPREVLLWDDHRAGPHGSRDARPYVLRVLRGSAISASASESSGMPSLRDSAARMPERGSASQVQSQLVGSAILAG